MKRIILISLLMITSFLIVIAGCSAINENFTEGYSRNPNLPGDSPPKQLFIGAETETILFFEGSAARFGDMWIRQATGADKQYSGYNNYNISANDFDAAFTVPYTEIRSNLKLVRAKSTQKNLIGISDILGSMVMGTVTALWGDVPYSDANKKSISDPHFDKQGQVYADMQSQLDKGISLLKNNRKDLGSGNDIFSYHGEVDKWIKAAYTLKARFYMHVSNYLKAIQSAKKGIMKLDGEGDLMIIHGNVVGGNANGFYQFLTGNRAGYLDASENQAYSLMKSRHNSKTDETGRMNFYYTSNGKDLNLNGAFAIDAPFPLVTAVENVLILAEAYARKNTLQGDKTAIKFLNMARQYNQIKFPNSTYEDLSISDFQAGGEYANTTILQEIFNAEYLSLAFQIEAFDFCRRIDYQVTGLTPSKGSKFPERFLYPQTALSSNAHAPEQTHEALFKPTPVNK